MLNETCNIFYSWQSQLPNATNRGFIEKALEISARAVREDATIDARPEVDQDTANVPGSPNIADVIRKKIDAAEIVICDVSIVQGLDGDGERVRPTPNANVLIELGYAMRSLGTTDRLVLVMNTAYGGIDKLPFDLRQYRPTTYDLPDGATNDEKMVQRKALVSKLEATFRHVLVAPSRHAAAQYTVDERQLALLTGQLARLAEQSQSHNVHAFHGKLDVAAIHYDGELLETAVRNLAPALVADALVMQQVQNVLDQVRAANAHLEQWRGWRVRTVMDLAAEDARAVETASRLALNSVKRMFAKA